MSESTDPTTCCPATRAALAALAEGAPDRVLCRTAHGEPITVVRMIELYDAHDPLALEWDAAVHGAALRMATVASRRAAGESHTTKDSGQNTT